MSFRIVSIWDDHLAALVAEARHFAPELLVLLAQTDQGIACPPHCLLQLCQSLQNSVSHQTPRSEMWNSLAYAPHHARVNGVDLVIGQGAVGGLEDQAPGQAPTSVGKAEHIEQGHLPQQRPRLVPPSPPRGRRLSVRLRPDRKATSRATEG